MVSFPVEGPAFARWRSNRTSGATALTREAAALLRREVESAEDLSPEALGPTLRAVGRMHPAFGSLWRLLDRVLRVAQKARLEGAALPDTRARLRESLDAFSLDLDRAEADLAREAASLVPEGCLVGTYSRSRSVERTLLEARARGRHIRVLLSEARPALEGVALARSLAREGIESVLTADAMLPMLLGRARVLLLGADALTPTSLIHKAGTYALLLAARELNLAAYVLSPRAKFVDPRPGTVDLAIHPPELLLPEPIPGVEAVNAPFEESPLALVRGVWTEGGFLTPGEVAEAARMAPLHESLAAPAESAS